MKKRPLSIQQRGLNFEMLMWIFTRISALAMYVLLFIALIGALWMGARTQMNLADVMRWAFMPTVGHVQNTDLIDLLPWATLFWKVIGSAFMLAAVTHGVHGLVVIADDYIVSSRGRSIVRLISMIMVASMLFFGLYIIWTS